MSPRRLRLPLAVAAVLLPLSGCAATVALEPAPQATAVGCAEVSVRLPSVVAEQAERETNAQGTAAWGSPAGIILHCGVESPGPTTLPCVEVNQVDWILDDSRAAENLYTFTTFGRDPAVQITVDQSQASGSSALVDLASAVSTVPSTKQCTDISDTGVLNTTPTPAPAS
ncbi:DUF3515 domain-containing protein [Rathayibacter sp. VKM Ac-2878]|nr:DUF3515 domain-containing protein [Rathayibacter sp. VKM Ac-2879]MBF4503946.1 DUF3515 domain-containing protein [Rathayibacter sp. VKM Ac-2878]